MSKVVGIISIKGGVGKTTTVANLGAVLATEFNKKVLVVDANFSAPNLGLHLGIINPAVTLHHVLLNRAPIKDAIYEHESGFHIIPSSYISRQVNPFKLKEKLEQLKDDYDIILIDSSPNLNDEILATMIASDELVVVSSPDYPTLSTTLRAIHLAKQKKTPITGLVLNKVRHKKFELTMDDIESAAGVPIIGVLSDDINVLEALAATTPVSLYKARTNTTIEFKKIASCLIGEEYKDPRWLVKLKSILKKTVPKEEVNRTIVKDRYSS